MLLLTRRPGEVIVCVLEDKRKIEFSIEGVDGNQVRVGVVAPKSIAVDRYEIHKRKFGEPDGKQ